MSIYAEHKQAKESVNNLFLDFQNRILNIDPVTFVEQNLTLDGKPFRLNGNGYKPFADIYRYIGLKAIEPGSKPVVLVKGRQVGATTMAAALECYFAACGLYGNSGRPPMRIMHAFPVIKLATAYAKDKLNPIISTSKPVPGAFKQNGMLKSFMECKLDSSNPSNDSQGFKKFWGGNQVWIESTGLNGDRLRGLTIDCLFMDEYQDMFKEAVGAASKILSQAKYGTPSKGVRVYFGTPKTKGGMYWDTWQSSTQQYYHLKCEKCNSYFPLYRPDVNWEDIWLYGFIVKCTDCGHEQDKRQAAEYGKWIALNNEEDSRFIGYHINQLYIPTFPKEAIIGEKPENNPHNSERTYMNEVLGEFFDGEGGTISIEEIREQCGDVNLKMVDRIYATEKRMYAGFDWGQKAMLDQLAGKKQGRSYSCGVILSADGPSLFSVNFAMRFKRTDPRYKIETVDEMMRRYRINVAVGDIGDAKDLTHELQEQHGERFLASRAAPRVSGHVKFNEDMFPKEIIFERDYYISELISLIKNGNIKFPFGHYDKIEWLVQHCTSMEVKVTRSKSGDPIKHYVKGSTPNDGFMALLNAYLAWKFDVTQKFTIKQPNQMKYDKALKNKDSHMVLGYVPGTSGF